MIILPLASELMQYIERHGLLKKFLKQKRLFEQNSWHPSLHTELLEPRQYAIYSFRLDRRYRALFIHHGGGVVEVIDVNDHYA